MTEQEQDETEPSALPAGALAMLQAYRDDEAMPPEARRRVWQEIAAPSAHATETRAPGRWGLWVGGGLAAAAVLLLATHLVGTTGGTAERAADPALQTAPDRAVTRDSEGDALPRRSIAHEPPAQDMPTAAARDEPTPAEVPIPAVRPAPRDRTHAPAVPPEPADAPLPEASATISAGDLAAERELIAAAWRALSRGSAAQAKRHAEAHARRFPHGMLTPEREAVHAIATCRESPRPSLAEAFERAHPRSRLGVRVRDACDPPRP